MNSIELIKSLGDMGVQFNIQKIHHILNYFEPMLQDGRVIAISEQDKLHAIITFSVTDDPNRFLKKDSWQYVPHDPSGKCLVIELIISMSWNRELRRIMEDMILRKYPDLRECLWYRYGKQGDRLCRTKRRLNYV